VSLFSSLTPQHVSHIHGCLLATLDHCCDLSELWYKEFYLELSKQIQFPIEMSLPWVLTDHVLSSGSPEMTEYFLLFALFLSRALLTILFKPQRNILYPLDLYNDAASRALHKLKARYLFDEIEAEVNLAFDQFIFKLSQNVFMHYKNWASSLLIQKGYKVMLEELSADVRYDAPRNRYKVILQQRHFQLLGRSIDISQLMAQRMEASIKKSLELAIGRFDASDLTQILELDALIQHNKIAHELLSHDLALSSFDELLAQADESSSLTLGGRILTHIVAEVSADVAPNFCYNSVTSRFIRPPFSLSDAVQRPHHPKGQPVLLFGAKVPHSRLHWIHRCLTCLLL